MRALCLTLALCAFAAPVQAQDDAPSPAYQALAQRATAAVTAGELDEALVLFRELHAMSPSARTLWALGRVHFERSEYVVAHEHLRAALDDSRRPLDVAQRANATELLRTAANLISQVTLEVTPSDAVVLVDGVQANERPLRLDPGEHTLRFEAPEHEPADRRVELAGGQQTTVQVALTPVVTDISNAAPPDAPREIQIDVRGPPGLRLYLRPIIEGPQHAFGPDDRSFETERPAHIMSGVYFAAVQRGDSIASNLQPVPLQSDAVLEVDYVDYEGMRIGGWTFVISSFSLGLAGTIAGGVLLDDPTPGTDESAIGTGLLVPGIVLLVLAAAGLGFPLVSDEAAVRVHPAWDAAGRL